MDGWLYSINQSETLDRLIASVCRDFQKRQRDDGHWVFELEADTTIPSEYVMLRHFLGDPDPMLEARIAPYLRAAQGSHGGWPLFHDGDFDISASVKAYYALKLIGDSPDAPHMQRARAAILNYGGAARANVFTRIALALFNQVPWRAVPVMPIELMLLPRWFPFHLTKIAYWSRVVIVPLLILAALKPTARNPRNVDIRELFVTPPEKEKAYNINPSGSAWGNFFLGLDRVLHVVEPFFLKGPRQRALKKALDFIHPRLNGEDGIGAIFPAMANVVMAYHALGYPTDHPDFVTARESIDKLLVFHHDAPDRNYCQPCVSPVWDTGLSAHALMEAGASLSDGGAAGIGDPNLNHALQRGLDWLRDRQILDVVGDWAERLKNPPRPGGWAFQYGNDFYPDVDDTAVVAMALHRSGDPRYQEAVQRAAEWVIGLQSRNGGWGAYDADNTHHYLNYIPFADHGALLDPPTADVTARCVSFLAQIGYDANHPVIEKGVAYLLKEQEPDGSWFGRWGTNYVYGVWSVLCALNAVGMDHQHPAIRRAVEWLITRQGSDGGWGEDCATYWLSRRTEAKSSTPSQTAWAVLALMSVGEVESDAVQRGVAFLENAPRSEGRWDEKLYTGVGFPRVFYLRYHGYAAYFPLWAISRYRTLTSRNDRRVAYGM
ncbi:Squalene--hopene cyclase [Azospirillaceae bacterium]